MKTLSRNEQLVFDALKAASGPQSAYALLDALRESGLRAPPQIYRALDKLVAQGIVHRIESLNAFVACHEPECCGDSVVAFTICDGCGTVDEINNPNLSKQLRSLAGKEDFEVAGSTIELRGMCGGCKAS